MRNHKILLFLGILAALGGTAQAQSSSSASATATATVVQPIQITATTSTLDFGQVAASAAGGGTVTLNPATNAITTTGSVTAFSSTGTAAAFTVTGLSGANYQLSFSPGSTITLTSGANSMSLALSADVNNGSVLTNLPLTGGSQTVKVGGALTLGSNQAAGNYSGSFTLTAQYQ
jgi:Mat/Ecp fimbriae major subunit